GDALQSWDTIDLSLSRYYALPNIPGVTASVLAWNFWTAYSPSWNKATAPNGIERNRPPMWLGPKLGGSTRMRGFNTNRFADKSALYTALEYRTVLHFNPLKQGYFGAWMKRQFPVEWFQTALFVEAGRVHSHYNPKLLEDMKYDVGFSVRTYIESILIRGAIAHSREGTQLTVSIDQPF
ncbi:MAG TPA: hypothetical protein ENK72_02695, partial [Epsilonproteobacteria bacterium]|nr:hypothetical protein [Campylobacterota bacterium]